MIPTVRTAADGDRRVGPGSPSVPSWIRRTTWSVVAVLIVLTYNSWVAWWPLNGNSTILHGFLSELEASDQPHHWVFRIGDLIAAALIAVTAVVGTRGHRNSAAWRPATVVGIGLGIFAVSVAVGAIFGMDCAPSLERSCAVAEATGRVSPSHQLHTLSGVTQEFGLITALIAAAVGCRAIRRTGMALVLLGMVAVEVVGLTLTTTFAVTGVQAVAAPQIITVLNASAAGALAALGCARPAR